MKKILERTSMLILSAMLAIPLAGCGGPSASSAPGEADSSEGRSASLPSGEAGGFKATDDANLDLSGEYGRCLETTPLRIGLAQSANITDYKDNKMTHWLEETCNVDLSFDLYPSSDAASKIRILISSGSDMPDIFGLGNFASLDLYTYGTEKSILPLNGYIDSYGSYYQAMLANDELYQKVLTMPDGNIYSVPKIAENLPNYYSQRAWINQKWLDQLGLEMPRTTDDLYQVLKAFVTKDPNGNGKPDEIGLAGSTDGWRQQGYNWIMNAFVYDQYMNDSTLRLNVADDGRTIYTPIVADEWRAGLSYMNMLYEEGLYSPQAFTQDGSQFQAMCNTEEGSLVGLITSGGVAVSGEDMLDYVPVPPLTGPEGVCWAAYFPVDIYQSMVITESCKTPGAAFVLLDTMLSPELSLRSRFGEPGVDCFLNEDGTQKPMLGELGFEAYLTPTLKWGGENNVWWQGAHSCYYFADMMNGQAWNGDPKSNEYIVSQAVPLYYGKEPEKVVNTLVYTPEEADEIRDPQNTICTYTKETIARFIIGEMDVDDDKVWQSYLSELDSMGLPRVMEINQAVYDRMYN